LEESTDSGPRLSMNRFAALCMLTVLLTGIGHAQTTGATHSAACTNPEYRQLDFWLGDWDVYEVSDSARAVARNRVTRILDGCVLRELYQQQNGMVGESYSLWDASRRVWHQSWVTNRGTLLLLDGHLDGDRMVLTGPDKTAEGRPALIRGIGGPKAGMSGRRRSGQLTGERPGSRCSISCFSHTGRGNSS
jgi:hypothetical protein